MTSSSFFPDDDSGYISPASDEMDSVCSNASSHFISIGSARKLEIAFEVSDLIVVKQKYVSNSVVIAPSASASVSASVSHSGNPNTFDVHEGDKEQQYGQHGQQSHDNQCEYSYQNKQMGNSLHMNYSNPSLPQPPPDELEDPDLTDKIELELVAHSDYDYLEKALLTSDDYFIDQDIEVQYSAQYSATNESVVKDNYDNNYNNNYDDSNLNAFELDGDKIQSDDSQQHQKQRQQPHYMLPVSNGHIERKNRTITANDDSDNSDANSGYVSSISDDAWEDENSLISEDENLIPVLDGIFTLNMNKQNQEIKKDLVVNRYHQFVQDPNRRHKYHNDDEHCDKENRNRILDKINNGHSEKSKGLHSNSNSHLNLLKETKNNKKSFNEDSGYISPVSNEGRRILKKSRDEVHKANSNNYISSDISYISSDSDEENEEGSKC